MTKATLLLMLVAGAFLASCKKAGTDAPGGIPPGSENRQAKAGSAGPLEMVTSSGVEMVYLPGGQFTMGNAHGDPDEAPPHPVTVSAFMIDKFEVTQDLFVKVQSPNPSRWQDHPKQPVERVRWRDAKQYCNERSLLEGLKPCYDEKTVDGNCDYSANGYRLPTEAEWEYACRAGADGLYDFGSPDKLRQFAWYGGNADQRTHPAGRKKPNGWGLYDMYGNVSEWCEDVYHPSYYREGPALNPPGPPQSGKDVKRVIRGGNWKSSAEACRATARQGERTGDVDACFSTDYCGFRCVRRVTPAELPALLSKPK